MQKLIDEQVNKLVEERNSIITELNELDKAKNIRIERLHEVVGGLKTLQELKDICSNISTKENTTE